MMQGGNMGAIRGGPMTAAPGGRVQGWGGRTAWGHNHVHDHFHNRFRNRNFFAFGFGGPIYDYSETGSGRDGIIGLLQPGQVTVG